MGKALLIALYHVLFMRCLVTGGAGFIGSNFKGYMENKVFEIYERE